MIVVWYGDRISSKKRAHASDVEAVVFVRLRYPKRARDMA